MEEGALVIHLIAMTALRIVDAGKYANVKLLKKKLKLLKKRFFKINFTLIFHMHFNKIL